MALEKNWECYLETLLSRVLGQEISDFSSSEKEEKFQNIFMKQQILIPKPYKVSIRKEAVGQFCL